MRTYEKLKKKPRIFRQLTGLSIDQFDKLLAQVGEAWNAHHAKQQQSRKRQRRPGAGRKPKLALAERLLLTLIYYRTYITQEFLGFLFGVDKGTACRIIRQMSLLFAGIFRIPERKVRINEDEMSDIFVDATERPINRPKKKQRRSFSGKKKRHTRKAQIIVTRKKTAEAEEGKPKPKQKLRIAVISESTEGKTHDKKLFDQSRTWIPPELTGYGDTAYQGTNLKIPKKKPKNGKLTKEEKRENHKLSKKRIVVEHGIGKMKIWRIAGDRYRNPLRRHTLILKNVAGLHNRMFSE